MNSTTPYEKILAQKMDGLAVPDMEGLIWERIAAQLDLPADTPDTNNVKQSSRGWIYALIVVILVALLVWKLSPAKTKLPAAPTSEPATKKQLPVPDSAYTIPVISPIKDKRIALPVKSSADIIEPFIDIPADSSQSVLPVQKDSLINKPVITIPFDSIRTSPPAKKQKGVKGISSDDYRIFGDKKDSLKKGN